MFLQEFKIAQSEHALFIARFNQPDGEGVVVQVPNIIDRAVATLRNIVSGLLKQPRYHKQMAGAAPVG